MKYNYEQMIKNFKNYRINYPLTQKELSEKTGISLRNIGRFENGEDITLSNFIKLLDALDLLDHMNDLIPNQDERPSSYLDKQHPRQRASKKRIQNYYERFKWGDKQ